MSGSASTWYYAADGERVGPRTLDEMRALLADGAIGEDTLVWTQGLAEWLPARELSLLFEAPVPLQPLPAPAPHPEPPADLPPAAHAWSRWLARMLDMTFFGVLALGAAGVDPATLQLGQPNLILLAMPGVWVPVEALLLALIGTTPGKALFNLRVETREGARPTFPTALSRSARVWVQGLGLSLPLVVLVTEAIGYTRLTRTGSTPWDDALALRVEQGRIGPVRTLLIAGLILMLAIGLGAMIQAAAAGA